MLKVLNYKVISINKKNLVYCTQNKIKNNKKKTSGRLII